MGDRIIITEDEDKPATPDVVVVAPEAVPKKEKIVTEKTTVTETRKEE
jgi:hypothetical protein